MASNNYSQLKCDRLLKWRSKPWLRDRIGGVLVNSMSRPSKKCTRTLKIGGEHQQNINTYVFCLEKPSMQKTAQLKVRGGVNERAVSLRRPSHREKESKQLSQFLHALHTNLYVKHLPSVNVLTIAADRRDLTFLVHTETPVDSKIKCHTYTKLTAF
jgi:hypothetical protein